MNCLPNRLKLLRENKGLSQRKMAQELGISAGSLGLYELGSRNPDPEMLSTLADYFNVSVDYLLGRTNIRDQMTYDAIKNDSELLEFWEMLSQRDELRTMFKKSKELRPEDIRELIFYIKFMEDRESKKYD